MIKAFAAIALVGGLYLAGIGTAGAETLLRVDGAFLKWAPSGSGPPTLITYAVLTGPYVLPGDRATLSPDNCGAMRPFADVVASSPAVVEAMAKQELRSAFTAWEDVANIKFVDVGDTYLANIIVGATASAHGRAFANLSYRDGHDKAPVTKGLGEFHAERPVGATKSIATETVSVIEQAYVCLNPTVQWKIGFDGKLEVYDLRHTFMHEIGHAIGLDHPGSSGSIMGSRYDERIRDLQSSDIAAAQQLYGPAQR